MAMPESAPITQIPGVDPSKLAGEARNLTKGQLIALSRGARTPALNFVEQQSIASAFEGAHYAIEAGAAGASCCCTCTPCCSCCASASIDPLVA